MTTHQIYAQRDGAGRVYPHCRRFGWGRGDCRRLACSRCGAAEKERLRRRVEAAARSHPEVFFLTVYLDTKAFFWFDHVEKGQEDRQYEKVFDHFLKKIIRAIRDLARIAREKLEYVAILAFGKVNHKRHKHPHSHMLVTWVPDDIVSNKRSKSKGALKSPTLDAAARKVYLCLWLEKIENLGAVVRYSVDNLDSALAQKWAKKIKLIRFSKGFEK